MLCKGGWLSPWSIRSCELLKKYLIYDPRLLTFILPFDSSRIFTYVAIIACSMCLSHFWELGPCWTIIVWALGAYVGLRFYRLREVSDDKLSFKIYTVKKNEHFVGIFINVFVDLACSGTCPSGATTLGCLWCMRYDSIDNVRRILYFITCVVTIKLVIINLQLHQVVSFNNYSRHPAVCSFSQSWNAPRKYF
jgi:hypothetical protein